MIGMTRMGICIKGTLRENRMGKLSTFNRSQIAIVDNSVTLAEELVSNYYKLSSSLWLKRKYDIKTLMDLSKNEIVDGPFAQILHYKGRRKDSALESESYDFYKICLQDHAILSAIQEFSHLQLFPFTLYIIIHELIHVVRFTKFLQNFYASSEEKMTEEKRVHEGTRNILKKLKLTGLDDVLDFYRKWIIPFEDLKEG